MSGIDEAIVAFGRKLLHQLPYADVSMEGFAIGEWVWFILFVLCAGEGLTIYFRKKVS